MDSMAPGQRDVTLFGQGGTDAVIVAAFDDVPSGLFVEIGCIDGLRFSNTLALERLGWTGLLVEAHPDYVGLVRKNRPVSHIVFAAAGDRDEEAVTLYANKRATLSSLTRDRESEWISNYGPWFHGFEERRVPMGRLSTLLDECGLTDVHVLSVDVEGEEPRVLRGVDFTRHRPDLIVVEADNADAKDAIDGILTPLGYHGGGRVSGNEFYFREAERLARVKGRRFEGATTYTAHPLDEAEDEIRRFSFVF